MAAGVIRSSRIPGADGGARDPHARRRLHGRQRRDPDHDGGVRALATRELGRANAWRIIRREAMVGLINGLGFAVIMGGLAGPGSSRSNSAS